MSVPRASSGTSSRTSASLMLIASTLIASWSLPALAAKPASIRVMLIGTYHFSNPGHDLNNVKAVDVLAPVRQTEIATVTSSLAKFAPTQVAVEWPAATVAERYPKYLAGTLPESRNEVVQLAFRLARERHLSQVHGIDVDGDFPFEAVQAWAGKHGRTADIEQLMADGAAETARISALQDETTIGNVLRDMNDPAAIARNHAFYPRFLTMGDGDTQPGAALVAAWYARNLSICARLLQSVQPGDRVVVFYGQGHIHLLQQCLSEQRDVEVVSPLGFL